MTKFALLASALLMATPALAVNNSFESGDLTGWSTNGGNAGATTGYGAFAPVDGSYLGFVEAGLGAYVSSTLSQTFSLSAGQTLAGFVGFQANDYNPFNDYASLDVNGSVVWSSNVATVGDYGNSGWYNFSYTAGTTGSYTLTLSVANYGDNGLSSAAVLDVVTTGGAVPEAATWAMLIAGFGLVGAVSRRRQHSLAA